MHEETMNRITKLVNERLDLYMLAGHQRLTDAQRDRITTITNQLPGLWDQYRRELAASKNFPRVEARPQRLRAA